ncbi:MAG TPA: MBL fold metallo-hydrolase [Thermoanaerobaculia bacterium]|nr:MBL fold metallo-hydrolase [Thermoanaerobaculia bacterium]
MVARSTPFLVMAGLFLFVQQGGAQDVPDGMRVHFINVGQGAATLVELPKGSILVDTGGEDNTSFDSREYLNDYLDAFFDRRVDLKGRLDLLVLTHPHPDHYLGMQPAKWWQTGLRPVLATYRPRNIVYNGGPPVHKWVKAHLETSDARAQIVSLDQIQSDQGLTNDVIDPFPSDGSQDPRVRILWGRVASQAGWCPADYEDQNNHSVVVRVDYGGASILVTGDLEVSDSYKCDPTDRAGIERILQRYANVDPNPLDVDVYQIGHHGSHNGTSPGLMRAMTPKIAVISAGPAYDRGSYTAFDHSHPREKTVKALEDAAAGGVSLCREPKDVKTFDFHQQEPPRSREIVRAVFSTGWDGTVVLLGKAGGFWSLVQPAGSLGGCS